MSRSIWAILGIRATRDVSEIKRAYAAKLKTIDMDADPEAFQALREAREIATRLAEQQFDDNPYDAEDDADAPAAELDGFEPATEPEPDLQAAEREPVDPVTAELNRHHDALCAILFDIHDGNFYPATPDEEQAMLHHFAGIAASPNLDNVDTLANASHWFAGAIAQMTPRSDALIEPASQLFGWGQSDELGEDPALAAVMQRRADLKFRDEVTQPSHRLNGAWNELIKPADEHSKRGWQSRRKVMELLGKVRSEHPTLERQMDWLRVDLWENSSPMLEARNFGPALIAIFIAIRIFSSVFDGPETPRPDANPVAFSSSFEQPKPARLTNATDDIDRAMRGYTGGEISAERLELENPKLYQLFKMIWYGKKEANASAMEFDGRVQALLNDHLKSEWSHADGEMLYERFRLNRSIAQNLARTSPEACSRYFSVGGEQQLHEVHRRRQAALTNKLILAIDPDRPVKRFGTSISFSLPSSVVEQVGAKSGVKEAELKQALRLDGEPLPLCKVHLALLDVVLDLPPAKRTPILRDMIAD